ncbi:hypothetical protein PENPOL_c003G08922 [Penicillium polonicum]|uniref:Cupin type-2 domain-containing protein n=1 Tax=Penicillium polonicum TaxID=60169 RepID=A0A1V6NSS6_PENPO|nr:hypothetical protein PENPOL_c003G08922 [Penicillium polonicum]
MLMSRVLGGSAERISASKASRSQCETTSAVYHVITGKGRSTIGEKEYTWEQGDTFCVPAWYRYQHIANAEEPVYLYQLDDKPMIGALGFYRSGDMDIESLVDE